MCDRYFVVFPKKAFKPEPAATWSRALKILKSEDVRLHPDAFFKSIYGRETKKSGGITNKPNRDHILRQNVSDFAKRTRHFSLLLTQFHWVGLLTLEQGRVIMSQSDDTLRGITMYRMLLKRDHQAFPKFINSLHMTGNHEIANLIEARGRQNGSSHLLVEEKYVEQGSSSSSKKRKGSADSGFGEGDEVTGTNKLKKSTPSTHCQDISKSSEEYFCGRRYLKGNGSDDVHKCSSSAYKLNTNTGVENAFVDETNNVDLFGFEDGEGNKLQKENRLSKFFAIFRS